MVTAIFHHTLASALTLAAQDRAVFPCRDNKAPACPHGFKAASRDPDPLRKLWRQYPGPLIGIATGAASDLAVLDLDAKHAAARTWWAKHRARLPLTFTVRTRSGGLHLWFRQYPGLRCSAGKIALGCDVRADGGYVVAWHAAGLPVLCDAPLAAWPEWLADMSRPTPVACAERPAIPNAAKGQPSAPYAVAALRNAVARVAAAAEGARNDALNAEMFALMRFVPVALTASEIADALAIAARHAGLTTRETAATLASALRAGGAR